MFLDPMIAMRDQQLRAEGDLYRLGQSDPAWVVLKIIDKLLESTGGNQ